MPRGKKGPQLTIPTNATGRVDLDRLAATVDWSNLNEFENLLFQGPCNYDKLLLEVKAAPELALLRWGENDDSILRYATGDGRVKLVRLLVRLGADVNASCAGERPLHEAAPHDVEISRLLLKHGAEVNAVTNCGRTPLHEAVVARNLPVVKLLLRNGAGVQAKDRWGYTPADLAALRHYPEIVVELLAKGSWVEQRKARDAIKVMQTEGWLETGPRGKLQVTLATVAALQS